MLVIGTVIGAGFASGREIVAFFGVTPSPWVALLCAAVTFVMCAVFLLVGKKANARDVSEVNARLAGRADVVLNLVMLFNSAISLAAMLAGFDSLFSVFCPIKPLYSVVFAFISVLIVTKGLNGLIKTNAALVPTLSAVIVFVTISCINTPASSPFTLGNAIRSITYIGMNMMLAASVLTTVNGLSKKQIFAASGVTAAVVGALVLLIILALGSSDAGNADMPIVAMSARLGKVVYGFAVFAVAAGIFTTMLTAHVTLTEWLDGFIGHKFLSAVCTAAVCLALGFMGFKTVVDVLYPVLGILGVGYFIVNLIYLFPHKDAKSKRFNRGKVRRTPMPTRANHAFTKNVVNVFADDSISVREPRRRNT